MRKIIQRHIKENIKEYIIFALIFIIGLFVGTMVLNNSDDAQKLEISDYLTNFTTQLKEQNSINYSKMIFELITKNIKLLMFMTFLSVSIIGIPALYFNVGYKGFNIGYTIAALSATFGFSKGLIFSLSLLLLSKMIEIPTIFFLSISGIKMYKNIIKDRSKENIKYAVTRYIINIVIAFILLVFSALIETYLSSNLSLIIIKYL